MTDKKNQPSELEVEAMENIVETSTGCKFQCKQVPPYIFMTVISQMEDPPEPPKLLDKNFPQWSADNEDADYYKDKREQYKMRSTKKMLDVFVQYGTVLVSKPEELEGPDDKDPEWLKGMKEVGIETKDDNMSWRYLNWVLTVAAPLDDDLNKISEKVKALTGVPEEDVAKAEKFPGRK